MVSPAGTWDCFKPVSNTTPESIETENSVNDSETTSISGYTTNTDNTTTVWDHSSMLSHERRTM